MIVEKPIDIPIGPMHYLLDHIQRSESFPHLHDLLNEKFQLEILTPDKRVSLVNIDSLEGDFIEEVSASFKQLHHSNTLDSALSGMTHLIQWRQ